MAVRALIGGRWGQGQIRQNLFREGDRHTFKAASLCPPFNDPANTPLSPTTVHAGHDGTRPLTVGPPASAHWRESAQAEE
jgi:hypothetical protein